MVIRMLCYLNYRPKRRKGVLNGFWPKRKYCKRCLDMSRLTFSHLRIRPYSHFAKKPTIWTWWKNPSGSDRKRKWNSSSRAGSRPIFKAGCCYPNWETYLRVQPQEVIILPVISSEPQGTRLKVWECMEELILRTWCEGFNNRVEWIENHQVGRI